MHHIKQRLDRLEQRINALNDSKRVRVYFAEDWAESGVILPPVATIANAKRLGHKIELLKISPDGDWLDG